MAQDRTLDRRCPGLTWLHNPRIGDLAARAIVIGEAERHFYELCASVIMPNHVHLLILPQVSVAVL